MVRVVLFYCGGRWTLCGFVAGEPVDECIGMIVVIANVVNSTSSP